MNLLSGNWCVKCGALETERARSQCSNPTWHIPNMNEALENEDGDQSE